MNGKDALLARCAPFLEANERIEHAFLVRVARRVGLSRFRIAAVTDRSIVLFDCGYLSNFVPQGLHARLPREPWTSDLTDRVWGHITLDRPYRVNRRWFNDVIDAENDLKPDEPVPEAGKTEEPAPED
jgi:hypothetical protein